MVKLLAKGKDPLELSIKKWQDIVKGTGENNANQNCALCWVYRPNHGDGPYCGLDEDESECKECPVFKKTGVDYCHNTPLDDYWDSRSEIDAQKEVDFLKSLRPVAIYFISSKPQNEGTQ